MIDFIGIDKLINEGKRVISFCLIFKLHENKSKIEIIINLTGSNKSTLRTILEIQKTLEKMAIFYRITLFSNTFSESQRLVEAILKVIHSS